jgi:hypothetical protein
MGPAIKTPPETQSWFPNGRPNCQNWKEMCQSIKLPLMKKSICVKSGCIAKASYIIATKPGDLAKDRVLLKDNP